MALFKISFGIKIDAYLVCLDQTRVAFTWYKIDVEMILFFKAVECGEC